MLNPTRLTSTTYYTYITYCSLIGFSVTSTKINFSHPD